MKNEAGFNRIFNLFVFVGMAVAITIITSIKLGQGETGKTTLIIAAIGSMMGVLSVLCSANAHILTFLFGTIDVSIYGIMCFINWHDGGAGLGNALIHVLYFLPMQFVGFFQWKKRKDNSGSTVKARRLTQKQRWFYGLGFVVSTIVVYILLLIFDRNSAEGFIRIAILMDAAAMVCNILGQFLLSTAYMEQWIFWIGVNISTVIMWVVTMKNGSDMYSIVYTIKYSFYLINSFNGLRIWINRSREC